MKKKVVVLKADSYQLTSLKNRLAEALARHFPLREFFSPGDKILLKPNLLMRASPDEAITTHPIFIEAVGRIFSDFGCPVYIADSPGAFAGNESIDSIYQACGVKEIAKRCGFEHLYPTHIFSYEELPLCWWAEPLISMAAGTVLKQKNGTFKIVNLPKLKTHGIMVLTSAVKNLYGCISGFHKSHLHTLYPKAEQLAHFLLRLYKMIRPPLSIVDGIVALEGDGPAKNGRPKKLGVVVLGNDALYTDYIIGRLVGLGEEDNPLIRTAKREKFLGDLEDKGKFEVVSEVDKYPWEEFKFPTPYLIDCLPKFFLCNILEPFFKLVPIVDRKKCNFCGACLEICPKRAIRERKGRAFINQPECIICMCCAEACRFGAVKLKKSALARFLGFIYDRCKL